MVLYFRIWLRFSYLQNVCSLKLILTDICGETRTIKSNLKSLLILNCIKYSIKLLLWKIKYQLRQLTLVGFAKRSKWVKRKERENYALKNEQILIYPIKIIFVLLYWFNITHTLERSLYGNVWHQIPKLAGTKQPNGVEGDITILGCVIVCLMLNKAGILMYSSN